MNHAIMTSLLQSGVFFYLSIQVILDRFILEVAQFIFSLFDL